MKNTVAKPARKVEVKATKKCPAHCENGYFYAGDMSGKVTACERCERCHGMGKVQVAA